MKMPTEKIDTAMFAPCGMNCLVHVNIVIIKNRVPVA